MKHTRTASAVVAALFVAMISLYVSAAPKKKEDDQSAAQLEYAKQLYGEGLDAMQAKDYATAMVKFKEAYRYAPDKHLFTFNIASAAELSGDCQQARTYYQMFLDLVPDHPERGSATKTLTRLQEDCPFDQETVETVTTANREDRAKERAQIEAENALQAALEHARKAARMYATVSSRHGGAQPFKRAAKGKKRHVKRILKLFSSHGLEPRESSSEEEGDGEDAFVPDKLPDACRAAASLEKRGARIYEEVLEHFDSREMYRVMTRLSRQADNRLRPAFQNSCPS